MELRRIEYVFLVGIGGIGMSAIARYFFSTGKLVAGYDRVFTDLTADLIREGISIHFSDNIDLIPEVFTNKAKLEKILIIYTPAIPESHKELTYFLKNGYLVYKRSEVLGLITRSQKGIAVAGTHGKTTVSTMIAHILHQSDAGCNAFLGGISKNYNSNMLISGKSGYVVVEADEFDRSFLQLFPFLEVITSIDEDHLDIYKDKSQLEESFKQFIKQIKPGGKLLINKKIKIGPEKIEDVEIQTYSLNPEADFYADNIILKNGRYRFDLICPELVIKNIEPGIAGIVNIENSVAAAGVAVMLGVNEQSVRSGLKSFKGIKRRFDIKIQTDKLIYIDDYAHHPEEIKAFIDSVRKLYPGKKITGIFQPHLFSRTRDFVEEFAKSLDQLDELILMEIYPAREVPIKGINSKIILDRVTIRDKQLCAYESLVDTITGMDLEVLLTMGAGDIDKLVEPIQNRLLQTHNN